MWSYVRSDGDTPGLRYILSLNETDDLILVWLCLSVSLPLCVCVCLSLSPVSPFLSQPLSLSSRPAASASAYPHFPCDFLTRRIVHSDVSIICIPSMRWHLGGSLNVFPASRIANVLRCDDTAHT